MGRLVKAADSISVCYNFQSTMLSYTTQYLHMNGIQTHVFSIFYFSLKLKLQVCLSKGLGVPIGFKGFCISIKHVYRFTDQIDNITHTHEVHLEHA